MSARDDDRKALARAIRKSHGADLIKDGIYTALAEELLAAGWRPPARVITRFEELAALSLGSVVMGETGQVFRPGHAPASTYFALMKFGHLTVLWEPGDDDE